MYRNAAIVFPLMMMPVALNAQHAVPATGTNATSSGGSISYTVGQVDYTVPSSPGGTLGEGVQQPYEYLVLSAEGVDTGANMRVLPNPTHDGISIEWNDASADLSELHLLDLRGNTLRTQRITGTHTFVPMQDLAPATYLIQLVRAGVRTRTIKIIKH